MPRARRRRVAEAVYRLAGPSVRRESTAVAVPREHALAWVLGVSLLAAVAAFLV
jgi:hypothetical protein